MTDDLLSRSDARRRRPQGRLHFRLGPEPIIYIIAVAHAALLVNFISAPRDHLAQINLSITLITLGWSPRLSPRRGSLRSFRRFGQKFIGFLVLFHYQLSVEIKTRNRTNRTCEGLRPPPCCGCNLESTESALNRN